MDHIQRIRKSIYYLDYDTSNLWQCINTTNTTWPSFKKSVLSYYLECDPTFLYTLSDLYNIVSATIQKGIQNVLDFSEYYRNFIWVYTYLSEHDKIGVFIAQPLFISAFDQNLQDKIDF